MSTELNEAIGLLDENKPDRILIHFTYTLHREPLRASMDLLDKNGYPIYRLLLDSGDRNEWDRLGKSIGLNTSVRELMLTLEEDDDISDVAYECLEAFYRGVEGNSFIESLIIDMNLFSDDRALPLLNMVDAQFKESLNHLILIGDIPLTNNQSFMISSVLENTSLKTLDMKQAFESLISSEAAFRRVVLACSRVNDLCLKCCTSSQYTAVATLLGNPTSTLSCLYIHGSINKQSLSTLVAGLNGNSTLKEMNIPYYVKNMSPIKDVLCNTSSIQHMYNSNHTLETINRNRDLPPIIADCLELNGNPNKDEVIKTKIARYYFVGDFDLTPFARMPVSILPRVLAVIRGDTINRQSAIFRMLKSIPDLCNVSSRCVGQVGADRNRLSGSNKRLKFGN